MIGFLAFIGCLEIGVAIVWAAATTQIKIDSLRDEIRYLRQAIERALERRR